MVLQVSILRTIPRQIIEFENGVPKFKNQVLKEIIEEAEAEDTQVFVIAVTGTARCGKSFLINVLQTYLDYYAKVCVISASQ